MSSTIIAQATPYGQSAIAIIRLTGSNALNIINNLTRSTINKPRTLAWVYNHELNSEKIDQALILYFPAPNSYTGEDIIEIHTHGNQLIINKIITSALHYGAVLAQPGEFTQRAYLNNKLSLATAESVADLIHARSEKLLSGAVNQYEGKFQEKINLLENNLINILSQIQAKLDFPLDTIDQELNTSNINNSLTKVKNQITRLLQSAHSSNLLREGVNTLILGRPNAGKSSLLNYILNKNRAIVSDIAGTTRDFLEEQIILGDIPLNLIDTAGIKSHTQDLIEQTGIDKALGLIKEAEVILLVIDLSKGVSSESIDLLNQCTENNPQAKPVIIFNKSDLVTQDKQDFFANYIKQNHNVPYIFISTKQETGLEQLTQIIQELIQINNLQDDFELSLNQRQAICLQSALNNLENISYEYLELASTHIQEAIYHLRQITGTEELDPEKLLDEVFSNFCIGK